LGAPTKGAVATGALLAGFPGLDAPARVRAGWEAAVAPVLGLAAALGALSGSSAALAVIAMALVGGAAGYCFSVSLRFSLAGLTVALALLIAQGLPLTAADAPPALLYATAGALLQAAFSLCVYAAGDRTEEGGGEAWSTAAALAALGANLTLSSTSCRHAIRFGTALAVGVAAYWLLGLDEHGFWIPLTILFVLRPERDETFHRLALRAVGTALGLVLATALSQWLHDEPVAIALILTAAAGFAFGMLTLQYALFTTAITVYVVLLSDTLGEPALRVAGQRALGTAIGIAIAGAAFLLWPNREGRGAPPLASPDPAR
jgi:Fusaric acid resistance protein-like